VITSSSKVRLVLQSRPESVTLARSMVAGIAQGAGLEERSLNALRTTISEASNNVVVHAYREMPGPLSISIVILPNGIDVLVEDQGGGIQRTVPSSDRMGLGLPVISSLADRAEFSSRPGGGTDVRLFFRQSDPPLQEDPWPSVDQHLDEPVGLSGDVVVSVMPVSLLVHILGRLSRALAAQWHFRVSRISDLRDITDAIALHAENQAGSGPIWFSLDASSRRLELSVGPFGHRAATAAGLAAAAAGGVRLADLVDDLAVDRYGDHEFLRLVVADDCGGQNH
jgi:anti-sigma regulatory factor (Ser/Thr protein kinase)